MCNINAALEFCSSFYSNKSFFQIIRNSRTVATVVKSKTKMFIKISLKEIVKPKK